MPKFTKENAAQYGSKGGQTRAQRHTPEEIKAWAREGGLATSGKPRAYRFGGYTLHKVLAPIIPPEPTPVSQMMTPTVTDPPEPVRSPVLSALDQLLADLGTT